MSADDSQFAWWSRLRHNGLVLSPVVQIEKYAEPPKEPKWYQPDKLRTAHTRFLASIDHSNDRPQMAQADILTWVDSLLENYIGHTEQRLARSHSIPESLTALVRIGSRTETLKPDRVLFDEDGKTPLLLIKSDTSPHIGRGKGRTEYARFLELLRGSGLRLGLLTNGLQFRLIYAGLDFESWCEWESDRWFEDTEGMEELLGLRQLLFPTQKTDKKGEVIGAGLPGLLHAVEESRKRQADLSQVLRENVRQAVELLLEDVSSASRTNPELFHALMSPESSAKQLTDTEAHEALLQATVRIVMRMVVCLFAESRGLLPVNDLIYSQAYGVRTLYELLDETIRHEGSQLSLMSRQSAWPRLMALYRLIYGGSSHGAFSLRPYGGALFRPGVENDDDPVSRALFILEHKVDVNDATIFRVLRKLLRGPLPVLRGRSKTYVEGPVDYTELRTEFIGLIYEGLLDFRVKRTTEEVGPQVFLNLGRQPVMPLSRLEAMLDESPKSLKDLFTDLKKESVSSSIQSEDEADDEDEQADGETETEETQPVVEAAKDDSDAHDASYLDAVQSVRRWARKAVTETKLVGKQRAQETDTEYDKRIEAAVEDLIIRVVAPGEFYLVRAGNTRKGTGTFYTRPQLAVPTVHRTLEPLCYEKGDDGTLIPKKPEAILDLKICDPACGSASFLVAAAIYLSEALYKSLCFHRQLDDPNRSAKVTLPFGKKRKGKEDNDEVVPFLPDDEVLGEQFQNWVEARLRRHVVERCIYGVDINPLAVEFARVSLWVETLDDRLPFSFLDHKLKVGNSLVGCWIDRVVDYPIRAWERDGGDGKDGVRTDSISTMLRGEKNEKNRRSGDGLIKRQMREVIESQFAQQGQLFSDDSTETLEVVAAARSEYEALHDIPIGEADLRDERYCSLLGSSGAFNRLRAAMDEWCSVWFWPLHEDLIQYAPTPFTLHDGDSARSQIAEKVAQQVKFFHWEIEFPDVFTGDRSGFDAVVGNPPWDIVKPKSQEFFSDHDPMYRSYSKQKALEVQEDLFEQDPTISVAWADYNSFFRALNNWAKCNGDPYAMSLARGNAGKALTKSWAAHRDARRGLSDSLHPFQHQGKGDLSSYKLFVEHSMALLRENGRFGMLLPAALYTDAGSDELRKLFLGKYTWEWLFSFENRNKIFEIHGSFKFAAVIVEKAKRPRDLNAAFMIRDLAQWESNEPPTFAFDTKLIDLFSPESKSVPEVSSESDLEICRTIYSDSIRLGQTEISLWELESGREFHMTDDSRHFPQKEKWRAKGYSESPLGHWESESDDDDIALPLYEGRMVGTFDPVSKGHVAGKGRSAEWRSIGFDDKRLEPQYLMAANTFRSSKKRKQPPKLGYMPITSATNSRTMISSIVPDCPLGNSVLAIHFKDGNLARTLCLNSILNSLCYDFVTRTRLGGLNLTWFVLGETPMPAMIPDFSFTLLVEVSARLSLIHRRFALDWLTLFKNEDRWSKHEWKTWWAVTEEDRLRLRVQNEAVCADAFGLEVEQFAWITRNDPSDPKGFWRVDKELPYEERLTGLSARAFRAMKEGRWSAKTAANLSNDEFFEILGIPELTSAEAAKAKGKSGPLILKRDGCHSWKPENFTEGDPRHGWTWDDCRKDAITLLGSEEALEEYIAKAIGGDDESEADDEDEPFQLKAEPAVKKNPQGELF